MKVKNRVFAAASLHRDEVDQRIEEDQAFVEAFRRENPSPLQAKPRAMSFPANVTLVAAVKPRPQRGLAWGSVRGRFPLFDLWSHLTLARQVRESCAQDAGLSWQSLRHLAPLRVLDRPPDIAPGRRNL